MQREKLKVFILTKFKGKT